MIERIWLRFAHILFAKLRFDRWHHLDIGEMNIIKVSENTD
jgi:hypothetical protein